MYVWAMFLKNPKLAATKAKGKLSKYGKITSQRENLSR